MHQIGYLLNNQEKTNNQIIFYTRELKNDQ
jgi:hypothetical protein